MFIIPENYTNDFLSTHIISRPVVFQISGCPVFVVAAVPQATPNLTASRKAGAASMPFNAAKGMFTSGL